MKKAERMETTMCRSGIRSLLAMLLGVLVLGAWNVPSAEDLAPGQALYALTFDKAAKDGQPVTLYLSVKDGVPLQGWLALKPLTFLPHKVDLSALKVAGAALKGELKVSFTPDPRAAKVEEYKDLKPFAFTYTLDVTVNRTEARGTFTAPCALTAKNGAEDAKTSGNVSGSLTAWPSSRADPSAKDFPCWRGRFSNGTANPSGLALVDSLAKARLLWKGEQKDLGIGYENRIGEKGQKLLRGGYASPIVADGRVHLYHFLPSSDDPDVAKRCANPLADDVVLGVDAVSGKTLWRADFRERGKNFQGLSKYGLHATPCAANGKVYAVGSCGGVYCVDAATGLPVWEQNLGVVIFSSCPAYGDGILIVNDCKGGAVGFDAESGKKVWGPVGRVRQHCSPIHWTHKGKDYFIADNLCLESRTGKVVWKADWGLHEARHGGGTYAVSEDYVVTAAGSGGKGGIGCFKIDEQGAKRVWALGEGYASAFTGPCIYDGYVYFNAGGKDPKLNPGAKPELVCIELETGKIAGALPGAGGGGQCVSPLATDGLIIARAPDKLCFYRPYQKGFKPLGEPLDLKWEWTITPAVADGRLYLRGGGYLMCYDLREAAASPAGAAK